jgi:hypothetical protein
VKNAVEQNLRLTKLELSEYVMDVDWSTRITPPMLTPTVQLDWVTPARPNPWMSSQTIQMLLKGDA